jgi:uncharacterized protein (DUF983 family)
MSVVAAPSRSLPEALRRGFLGRCPNCGEGRLLRGYLTVELACAVCGQDFTPFRADDGPAYLTILLVGHLVVAPLLCFPFIWTWNPVLVVALSLSLVLGVTLTALPRIKGAFIGLLWANGGVPQQ